MSDLQTRMAEALAMGLRRKTLTICSKWAEMFIRMGKPFPGKMTFKYHPWTKEMHDCRSPKMVGQKAAQVGYTVTMMNRAFFRIDQLKESVLYLLPSKTPDATDFSSTKFDPALELSPHLDKMFSDVKNIGTKRAGTAILYIRGSNSRKGLKTISVSEVICDEYDEMPSHTIPLAQERMSGQPNKQLSLISTPRFPGEGINEEFLESTQEHFHFPCPSCSKLIELTHDNLVVTAEDIHDPKINDSYIKCLLCDQTIYKNMENTLEFAEHKAHTLKNGIYVPHGHKDFESRGFYVNQLYSPTIQPKHLAATWLRSLTNKSAEQEYHNSKMGLPHEVDGARISLDQISACIKNYDIPNRTLRENRIVTMGVDVGRFLHYEIAAWDINNFGSDINVRSNCYVIDIGKKIDFEELDTLMYDFQIMMVVIDVQPETRKALEFAKRFVGHVKLCRYGKGLSDKTTILEDSDKYIISVDRTSWLDLSLGRFHNQTISLPRNTSVEYRGHIRNIARVYEEDKDKNQVGRYISNGDDHFAHARNYNELALPLAAAFSTNSDIAKFL